MFTLLGLETFPTIFHEALAYGIPVVASEVCSIPERVVGWEDGFPCAGR